MDTKNTLQKVININRGLSLDQVNSAQIGHSGMALGSAPAISVLFKNHIVWDLDDPNWINRDRFVLSAGHGSAMLYSMLFTLGYVELDDLMSFRKLNSKTAGHPENILIDAVDYTTGPLGQGIAMGIGSAMAEVHWNAKFQDKNISSPINYRTYIMCGDGDLQEGVAQEAIAMAGLWKLGKVTLLYDSNDIQLDGPVEECANANIKKLFEAYNWHYQRVEDGENTEMINVAIENAKATDQPSIIEIKTIIGRGSPVANTSKAHGAILNDDVLKTKKYFGINEKPFTFDKECMSEYQNEFRNRTSSVIKEWEKLAEQSFKAIPEVLNYYKSRKVDIDWSSIETKIENEIKADQIRNYSSNVLQEIMKESEVLVALNADLGSSTKVVGTDKPYNSNNKGSNYIKAGVREFATVAVANGMTGTGLIRAIPSSFLVFSDYAKPALRLGAISEFPTLSIFSHDSIWVGTDGPTHQPVEQYAMLRAMPNLLFFRPADQREVLGAIKYSCNSQKNPSLIATSRQKVEMLENSSFNEVKKGAYIVHKSSDKPDAIIVATGSEVAISVEIAKSIKDHKINVVSMPCMELFDKQNDDYQRKIIPRNVKRISFEMGSTFGWHKYVGDEGLTIGVDHFGASSPEEELISYLKLDKDNVQKRIEMYLNEK